MATDVVFETKATENLQVHYDPAQKWYYLQDQEPSELLVFRQTDSRLGGQVGKLLPVLSSSFYETNRSHFTKGYHTHHFQILWPGRTSCQEKALKFGRLYLMDLPTEVSILVKFR